MVEATNVVDEPLVVAERSKEMDRTSRLRLVEVFERHDVEVVVFFFFTSFSKGFEATERERRV